MSAVRHFLHGSGLGLILAISGAIGPSLLALGWSPKNASLGAFFGGFVWALAAGGLLFQSWFKKEER